MQIKQQSTVQQAVNITGFSNPLYSPYYFSPDHDIFSPCQNPAFVSLLTQSTCSHLCLDRSCLSTTTTLTSNSFLSIILCAHLTFLNNISFSVHMPFYTSTQYKGHCTNTHSLPMWNTVTARQNTMLMSWTGPREHGEKYTHKRTHKTVHFSLKQHCKSKSQRKQIEVIGLLLFK